MTTPALPTSWILLEHTEKAERWGGPIDPARIHFLLLTAQGARAFVGDLAWPAEWDAGEPFLVLVFLPKPTASRPAQPLPDGLWKLLEKRAKEFGVWCHYGGNISLPATAQRWKGWDRLPPGCRDRLMQISGSSAAPQPFSDQQEDLAFNDLKRAFKAAPAGAGLWTRAAQRLGAAWIEAEIGLSLELRKVRVKHLHHRAILFHEIERRLTAFPGSTPEKCRYAGQLFQRFGMRAVVEVSHRPVEDLDETLSAPTNSVLIIGRALAGLAESSASPSAEEAQQAEEALGEFLKALREFKTLWQAETTRLCAALDAAAIDLKT